jgi:hypothetical protein
VPPMGMSKVALNGLQLYRALLVRQRRILMKGASNRGTLMPEFESRKLEFNSVEGTPHCMRDKPQAN